MELYTPGGAIDTKNNPEKCNEKRFMSLLEIILAKWNIKRQGWKLVIVNLET